MNRLGYVTTFATCEIDPLLLKKLCGIERPFGVNGKVSDVVVTYYNLDVDEPRFDDGADAHVVDDHPALPPGESES